MKRAVGVVGLVTLIAYSPLLVGRIPFPADVVTGAPPWREAVRQEAVPRHAEMSDLATQVYPWRAFLGQNVREGRLPLWNPRVLLGVPFVAEPQTAIFYPLNLLYDFLPALVAWALSFPIRMFLAGLFAALLARELGAGETGAAVSGIVFACCGFLTSFAGWATADTPLWLPLACLAVLRLLKKPGWRSVLVAGVAFALPVLAGHVENAMHLTIVAAAFFVWNWLFPAAGQPSRARTFALFALAGVLAVALAGVQLLPTIEWIGQLRRSIHRPWTANPLADILNLVSRDQGGDPNSVGVRIPEGAGYAGMLTLLLAPLALVHSFQRNRRNAVFFLLAAACCIQVIYGLGPLYQLSREIPILRGAANGRLIAVVDFSLAMLAGLGASAVEERLRAAPKSAAPRAWWMLAGAGLVVSAAGVAVLFRRFQFPAPGSQDEPVSRLLLHLRSPLTSALFLAAAVALLAAAFSRRSVRRFGLIATGLLAADLLTATIRHVPFVRARDIFPPAPTFDFLKAHAGNDRVTSVDGAYTSNAEMIYGLNAAGGYDILLRRTARLLSVISPPGNQAYPSSERILAAPSRFFDLLNVRYLVSTTYNEGAARLAARPDRFTPVFSEGVVRIFENRTVLPPAILLPASAAEIVPGEEGQFRRLTDPGFDPSRTVLLDAPLPAGAAGAASGTGSRVLGFVRETNRVQVTVAAGEPSLSSPEPDLVPGVEGVGGRQRGCGSSSRLLPDGGAPAGGSPAKSP